MTRSLRAAALVLAVALLTLCWGYRQAMAPPVLRQTYYAPAGWPAGAAPLRLVVFSDAHIGMPDMPLARFVRFVDRVNKLRPDCVLIAGDFFTTKLGPAVPNAAVVAAVARLRPRIATIVVRGNHDRWDHEAVAYGQFQAAGLVPLWDQAARCGPLAIVGLEDEARGNFGFGRAWVALHEAGGLPILLTHQPDRFADAIGVGLTLAGHTHCGQIVLPFVGPIATASRYGRRYYCGIVREGGRFLITTAGLGTSMLPLRWNAPPDFWLITVGPARRGPRLQP